MKDVQDINTARRNVDFVASVALELSPERAKVLRRAVDTLREFYAPPAIFLFGSTAKGIASDLSDIDLLVRMESKEPRMRRGSEFREVFSGSYPRVDLVVFTDAEIRHHRTNRFSFLSSVLAQAKPLFLKNAQTELLLVLQPS
jgi:predicted nucleotidyltransferase